MAVGKNKLFFSKTVTRQNKTILLGKLISKQNLNISYLTVGTKTRREIVFLYTKNILNGNMFNDKKRRGK